jgi:hypothetical protein
VMSGNGTGSGDGDDAATTRGASVTVMTPIVPVGGDAGET